MNHRLERVCEVLRRELGQIILRDLSFPTLVTISSVDITPDLKQAHVFVSALGTKNQKAAVLAELEKHRTVIQAAIAKRVFMKHTPQLHFKFDEAIERGSRVLGILDELGLDGKP